MEVDQFGRLQEPLSHFPSSSVTSLRLHFSTPHLTATAASNTSNDMDGGDHSGGGSQQRALIIWQEDPLARYKTTTENAPGGQHVSCRCDTRDISCHVTVDHS